MAKGVYLADKIKLLKEPSGGGLHSRIARRNSFFALLRPDEPSGPSPRPSPRRMGRGEFAGRQSAQLAAQFLQRSGAGHRGTNDATGLPLLLGGAECRGDGT